MPTLEDILNAIDTLRTRLPELVGADRWPEFERRLEAYLADLGDNRLHPVIVQALILRLFAEARPAHLALLGIIDPEQAAARASGSGYDPHEAAAAVPKGLETFTAADTPAQSPISRSPISDLPTPPHHPLHRHRLPAPRVGGESHGGDGQADGGASRFGPRRGDTEYPSQPAGRSDADHARLRRDRRHNAVDAHRAGGRQPRGLF